MQPAAVDAAIQDRCESVDNLRGARPVECRISAHLNNVPVQKYLYGLDACCYDLMDRLGCPIQAAVFQDLFCKKIFAA